MAHILNTPHSQGRLLPFLCSVHIMQLLSTQMSIWIEVLCKNHTRNFSPSLKEQCQRQRVLFPLLLLVLIRRQLFVRFWHFMCVSCTFRKLSWNLLAHLCRRFGLLCQHFEGFLQRPVTNPQSPFFFNRHGEWVFVADTNVRALRQMAIHKLPEQISQIRCILGNGRKFFCKNRQIIAG